MEKIVLKIKVMPVTVMGIGLMNPMVIMGIAHAIMDGEAPIVLRTKQTLVMEMEVGVHQAVIVILVGVA